MRALRMFAVALAAAVATPAAAKVRTEVQVETYRVSGATGEALVKSMDRNGPRHGFLARAIAQTRYTIEWDMTWETRGTTCRVAGADVKLSIRYRYPALSGPMSPKLKRGWGRFLTGVKKHEEVHGRLAREMATTAHKAVARYRGTNDPSCARSRREVSRMVQEIYARYEARQQEFDQREHSPGGNVDRLVSSLLSQR
jgi:predicted secreted Zn-dependent protease